MSNFFKNFVVNNQVLNFDVFNLDSSFCNTLRRIMISEIETLGFRTSYSEVSDIEIELNTSALHNEFLSHRLSLLPIKYSPKDIQNYVKDKFTFVIDVVNKGDDTINVTSKDIKIFDNGNQKYLSDADTKSFFPPNPLNNEYILINKLKANKTEGIDGEAMKVKMKADKGIGKEHSRYTPTCVSIFTNKIDEAKIDRVFKDKLAEREDTLTPEEIKDLAKSFRLSEGERHFFVDENGEPNVFEFTVESDGRIPPYIILNKALFIMEKKLKKFISNLDNEEVVTFQNSDCIMNSFDVKVQNEDYTLGTVLQKYIYTLYQMKEPKDVKYVSSNIPHPLENVLLFRIALENSVDTENSIANIKKILVGTVDYLLSIIVKLKGELKNEFKSNLDL